VSRATPRFFGVAFRAMTTRAPTIPGPPFSLANTIACAFGDFFSYRIHRLWRERERTSRADRETAAFDRVGHHSALPHVRLPLPLAAPILSQDDGVTEARLLLPPACD